MKYLNLTFLLVAAFLIVLSSCRKEQLDNGPGSKTELELKMEAQGWERIPDARLVEFNEASIEEVFDEVSNQNDDVSFFVAIDEKMVFKKIGYNETDEDPDDNVFDGLPSDYDPKEFLNYLEDNQNVSTGRSILGADTRFPITSSNLLRKYPFRAMGAIKYCSTCVTGCSGVLIGPRHVLTAAHCLVSSSGWVSQAYFVPGQLGVNYGANALPSQPNGSARRAKYFYARSRTSTSNDYGLIILEDEPRTASLGWFGRYWTNTSNYEGMVVNTGAYPGYGYECDFSPRSDSKCGGFMYTQFGGGKVTEATSGTLYYNLDTQKGQSGSTIFRVSSTGIPYAMAVHKGYADSRGVNYGSRMRSSMWGDISTWRAAWPSQY